MRTFELENRLHECKGTTPEGEGTARTDYNVNLLLLFKAVTKFSEMEMSSGRRTLVFRREKGKKTEGPGEGTAVYNCCNINNNLN